MTKGTKILGVALVALLAAVWLLKTGNIGTQLLWNLSDQGRVLWPLITVAALIDSINPCAFSILILTIAFLFTLGVARGGMLKIGGAYILGIFVVYILIGLGILQALHLFNTPHFMGKLGAGILIAWGIIELTGALFPRFPIKLGIPHAAHEKIAVLMKQASLPAAFMLGALVGVCEFPCTGGPYLMVLGLLHDQGTDLRGLGYLLVYNLIFVLPLVAVLLIASQPSLLAKVQNWKKQNTGNLRYAGGILMILLGLAMLAI